MAVKIITDTSCDLPDDILEQYDIEMIPLKVAFANGETFLDRFEISPKTFWARMMASKFLPQTSAPDPVTFLQYFEQGLKEKGEVIFISLSSGLSSTFQTARMACDMLGINSVRIFDTFSASMGTGLMAIKAARLAMQGCSLDTLCHRLINIRSKNETIFTLDSLENVVKGGRLSRIEGLAGTILNIKPILRGINGRPEVIEKVRGRKKAIKRLLTLTNELGGENLSARIVGITHVDCENEALELEQEIKKRFNPQKIIVSEMGATIGTYAGQGGLMINF
ncbi:MAG TPA: DegV family protein [Syntrophomonas sp.]|jgi:DegV family protein with EDD domain|nr:DegV family protein [Syntrophomonas sp.]